MRRRGSKCSLRLVRDAYWGPDYDSCSLPPQVFEQLFQAYEQKMPVPGKKEFDQLVRFNITWLR